MTCAPSNKLLDLSDLERSSGGADSWPRTLRRQPLVIPENGGRPKSLTRTTTLAGELGDDSSLNKWRMRMVLGGAARNPLLVRAAGHLDPETGIGKRELGRLAEKAFDAGGGNVKSALGTWRHTLSEYIDRGEDLPECSADDREAMDAYARAVAPIKMLHIEQAIVTSEVGAAGTADRIGETELRTPDGVVAEKVIIDLKTGDIERSALKIAGQLGCYANGKMYDPCRWIENPADQVALAKWRMHEFTKTQAKAAYREITDINRFWALIVHLPAGTNVARLVWVNIETGWWALQDAARVRSWRSERKLLVPVNSTK